MCKKANMKKCIIIPDSFKGTMSSECVANIMSEEVHKKYPKCEIVKVPISDGGEGMVACMLNVIGGEVKKLTTTSPYGEKIESFYGISGDAAIIEMAASAGLHLATSEKTAPLKASTYGVGELINDAIDKGCKKIFLGLGGSCTNDAGAGMASAVGVKFYDKAGNTFIPVGGTLSQVAGFDLSLCRDRLKGIEVIAMCDINNPMFGKNGAAYMFAPQKGADEETVKILDNELKCFAAVIEKCTGQSVHEVAGAGAAGAMGAGVIAFLGGRLANGISALLDIINFEEMLKGCDCVITGEGRLDEQSLNGKAINGIAERAKKNGVPVVVVVGEKKESLKNLMDLGVTSVYETSADRKGFADIKLYCKIDLARTMQRFLAREHY